MRHRIAQQLNHNVFHPELFFIWNIIKAELLNIEFDLLARILADLQNEILEGLQHHLVFMAAFETHLGMYLADAIQKSRCRMDALLDLLDTGLQQLKILRDRYPVDDKDDAYSMTFCSFAVYINPVFV